jgi:tetratricopeptide (TPR) repeat protein
LLNLSKEIPMNSNQLRKARNQHIEVAEYEKALYFCNLLNKSCNKELIFEDWFKKGLCHFKLDQNEQAVECYENALKIDDTDFQAMTNKAISLLRIGKANEAFQLFRKALSINPNIGPAWFNVGLYHIHNIEEFQEAFEKAINAFRRAVRLIPTLSDAEVYFSFEDINITIDNLLKSSESVIELDDNNILVIHGEAPIRKRTPEDPQSWSSSNPNAFELNQRALSLCSQGHNGKAIRLLNQALTIDPEYITAWYNKGKLLRTMSRFEESVACCDKITAIDTKYPDVWTMLGNNLLNLNRYEEAISAFKKALNIDDTDPRAWYNKAKIEEKLGMYSEAMKSYEQFVRVAPVEYYGDQIDRARSIIQIIKEVTNSTESVN